MRMVWCPALLSGLSTQHCCELWCRSQTRLRPCVAMAVAQAGSCSSETTPNLGTSMCCKCDPKKEEEKEKKKNICWIKLCLIIIIMILCFSSFLFFFLVFLGPHLQYMEFPRLGVESELQPLSYVRATATQDPSRICHLHHRSRQHPILNPLNKAWDLTLILMDTSRDC